MESWSYSLIQVFRLWAVRATLHLNTTVVLILCVEWRGFCPLYTDYRSLLQKSPIMSTLHLKATLHLHKSHATQHRVWALLLCWDVKLLWLLIVEQEWLLSLWIESHSRPQHRVWALLLSSTVEHCCCIMCCRFVCTTHIYTCVCMQNAPHCITLKEYNVTHCSTLQHTATHCSTLQHTASHCTTVHHIDTIHCNTLKSLQQL